MKMLLIFVYAFFLGVGYAHACDNEKSKETVKENLKRQYLRAHNKERRLVGIPKLSWDKGLAELAENYARQLAQKCGGLVHSKGTGYGENLASKWGGRVPTGFDFTAMWVEEKQWYDYKNNSSTNGKPVGHYTQIVWKNTRYFGCGQATCTEKSSKAIKTYSVCNYDPRGNFRGKHPY